MATVNDNRPVNLDLRTIKLPAAALTSITHRITGIILFFSLPILLWMLDKSLTSEDGFNTVLDSALLKLVVWGVLSSLIYHIVAGVQHLVLDYGWGYEPKESKLGITLMLSTTVVLILLAGVWIWV